jgi:hypothetical protein
LQCHFWSFKVTVHNGLYWFWLGVKGKKVLPQLASGETLTFSVPRWYTIGQLVILRMKLDVLAQIDIP